MKFGLSLSGLLQHSRDADMVQRFADVVEGAMRLAAREVLPVLRRRA